MTPEGIIWNATWTERRSPGWRRHVQWGHGNFGGSFSGNTRPRHTRRSRGHIEKLKSGSLRVKVYAGHDKLLQKPLYLQETVPAGPDDEETRERAEQLREEFLERIRAGDHPRSDATVDQLMAEYLEDNKKLGRKTRSGYQGNHRKHISRFLGRFKINSEKLDSDLVDDFYAELERCRDHCEGSRSKPAGAHWSPLAHRCDHRCGRRRTPPVCTPLPPEELAVWYAAHWHHHGGCHSRLLGPDLRPYVDPG